MKRIFFISEYMNPPFDEGIKKTVISFFNEIDQHYNVQMLSRCAIEKDNILITKANPLFISNKIRISIREFNPDVLIYFPFASTTFASYMRMKILALYVKKNTKTILVALQPKKLKKWQQWFVKLIKPSFALTPSPILKSYWDNMKVKNTLVPLITDLSRFKPIEKSSKKIMLRKKYDLPIESFIISHIGHLNEGRNLKPLKLIQGKGVQIIVIGSSSTPKDSIGSEELRHELTKAGIIILDRYIKNIEEIYQLSDAYIFPVLGLNSSIGMPLSILEARACGIPVITTNFGSIKTYLDSDYGNIYYYKPTHFNKALIQIRNDNYIDRKRTKISVLNTKYLEAIHESILLQALKN